MAGSHESAGSGPGPPGQGGARDGKGRSTLGPARSARNSGGNEEVQGCVGLGRVFDAGRSLGARQATLGASDTVDTSSSDPPGASASRAVDTPSDHPERPASAPGNQVGIVPASFVCLTRRRPTPCCRVKGKSHNAMQRLAALSLPRTMEGRALQLLLGAPWTLARPAPVAAWTARRPQVRPLTARMPPPPTPAEVASELLPHKTMRRLAALLFPSWKASARPCQTCRP